MVLGIPSRVWLAQLGDSPNKIRRDIKTNTPVGHWTNQGGNFKIPRQMKIKAKLNQNLLVGGGVGEDTAKLVTRGKFTALSAYS